jgi:DNA mismatch repair protein MutS
MNIPSIFSKYIPSSMQTSNEKEKSPEEKKEHELSDNDRMLLITKKVDENFLTETYENIISKKNFMNLEVSNQVIVNDYVFNDIEFLQDHYANSNQGLIQKLDKCQTKIGSLLLKYLFLKPVHSTEILKSRQNSIKKISKVRNQILPLLKEIKLIENDLIWFWNNNNLNHIELMNDLIYFNYDIIPFFNVNEVLNNNERALLITNIYKIIVSPLLTILTPLISLLIPLIFLFYMQRKMNLNISIWTVFKQYIRTLLSSDSMKFFFKNPTKAMLASVLTKGIYLFMYFQNIYYSIQSSSNTNKIINIIHEKLNKMTTYTNLVNQMKTICAKNDLVDLSQFIEYKNIQDDLALYEDYFNSPVFKTNPHIFSNKGKILCTFKKFKEHKESMINVFHYSGIIDALLSIESLISSGTEVNPYCFTKYIEESHSPHVNMKDIWHPYLDISTVPNTVKNSIDINNNILITGPNAAGKSTFIKSVILNIILSQTIGISSASQFEITPFKMIETYLHIPDSKGSTSLFEAEMFRSKDYIEKIKNMDQSHFSFIVLDEIFSSTNYIEGFSGAYSILKKISSFDNAMSITTTHYTDLEILEKDTGGKISNYKFEVNYENEEIKFNYLLKKGVSRQYIALDLLKKNGFDNDVIEDAIKMCNNIKEKKLIFFQQLPVGLVSNAELQEEKKEEKVKTKKIKKDKSNKDKSNKDKNKEKKNKKEKKVKS